jgi:uncharacterized protein YceK
MSRASRAAVLPILVVLVSGCGTMANISIGARQGWQNALIYGGVRRDVKSAEDFVSNNWTSKENADFMQDTGTIVGVGLVGIDVSLSAIADTLTLPITIPAAIWGGPGKGGPAAGVKGNSSPPAPTTLAVPATPPIQTAPPVQTAPPIPTAPPTPTAPPVANGVPPPRLPQ